jgi:hypothetical protein
MNQNSPQENNSPILTVVINGQPVIEYDRRKPLVSHQRLFLDRMDRDMDAGIAVEGERVVQPDLATRARFVASSLIEAAENGNDSVAAATCSWLALRLPDLKQVRADSQDGRLHIDLVFDKPYVPVQTVQFPRPDKPGKPH